VQTPERGLFSGERGKGGSGRSREEVKMAGGGEERWRGQGEEGSGRRGDESRHDVGKRPVNLCLWETIKKNGE